MSLLRKSRDMYKQLKSRTQECRKHVRTPGVEVTQLLISVATSTVSRSNHLSYVRIADAAQLLISCYCDTNVQCECHTFNARFPGTEYFGEAAASLHQNLTPIARCCAKQCDLVHCTLCENPAT